MMDFVAFLTTYRDVIAVTGVFVLYVILTIVLDPYRKVSAPIMLCLALHEEECVP